MEATLSSLRSSGATNPYNGVADKPPIQKDGAKRNISSIRRLQVEQVNQDLLHRTVQDSCKFAYGVKIVEVWVWDPIMSKLFRPEGGWFIDPHWHDMIHVQHGEVCPCCQLVDASRNDYVAPPTLSPGVGIPGVLWADLGKTNKSRRHRRTGSGGSQNGPIDGNLLLGVFGASSINEALLETIAPKHERIAWRDVQALAADPDQPQHHRLKTLTSTDIRWSGGVPFQINGEEGIVIYYARESVNTVKLKDQINTAYLVQAADFIGSAWALRVPRMTALQRRQDELSRNFQILKDAMIRAKREGRPQLETEAHPKPNKQRFSMIFSSMMSDEIDLTFHKVLWQKLVLFAFRIKKKTRQSVLKLRGGGTTSPPAFGWSQAIFTAVSALVACLTLAATNAATVSAWGQGYSMPMGPFGALLGLQFGLTAAPAAQPRTIVVGQVVSILVALAFAEITSIEQSWVKQSMSCALSIGIMAKIGVVNPPAAANAFLMSDGSQSFSNMLVTMVGSILAIFLAIFINNMSDLRQYPSFWGIPAAFQCECIPSADPPESIRVSQSNQQLGVYRGQHVRSIKNKQTPHNSSDHTLHNTVPVVKFESDQMLDEIEAGTTAQKFIRNDTAGRSTVVD